MPHIHVFEHSPGEYAWFVDGVVHVENMPCAPGAIEHGTTVINGNTYKRFIATATPNVAEAIRRQYRNEKSLRKFLSRRQLRQLSAKQKRRSKRKAKQAEKREARRKDAQAMPIALVADLPGTFRIIKADGSSRPGLYRYVARGERGDVRALVPCLVERHPRHGWFRYFQEPPSRITKSFKRMTEPEILAAFDHQANGSTFL